MNRSRRRRTAISERHFRSANLGPLAVLRDGDAWVSGLRLAPDCGDLDWPGIIEIIHRDPVPFAAAQCRIVVAAEPVIAVLVRLEPWHACAAIEARGAGEIGVERSMVAGLERLARRLSLLGHHVRPVASADLVRLPRSGARYARARVRSHPDLFAAAVDGAFDVRDREVDADSNAGPIGESIVSSVVTLADQRLPQHVGLATWTQSMDALTAAGLAESTERVVGPLVDCVAGGPVDQRLMAVTTVGDTTVADLWCWLSTAASAIHSRRLRSCGGRRHGL